MGGEGEATGPGRRAVLAGVVATGTFLLGLVGAQSTLTADPAIGWPASWFGIAVVLTLGLRYLPAVLLGNGLALATTSLPAWVVLAQVVALAAGIVLPALLLRRWAAGVPRFDHLHDLVRLGAAAALNAALIGGIGTLTLWTADVIDRSRVDDVVAQWLVGEASTTLAFVPAVLVMLDRSARMPQRRPMAVVGVATLLIAGVVGGVLVGERVELVFPGVVFAGILFCRKGAAIATLVVYTAAASAAAAGIGLFADVAGTEDFIGTTLFVVIAALTGFALGILTEERVEALEEAERGRGLLRQIIDSSPAQFFAKDLEGRYTLVSPAVEEATKRLWVGRQEDEMLDSTLTANARSDEAQVLETGEAVSRTFQFEGRWHDLTRFPLRDPDGVVYGIGAFILDVTERRAMHDALEAREALLARTEAMARIGGWSWDVRADSGDLSPQTYAIYGRDRAKPALGLSEWLSVVHPDDRERVRAAGDAALARREPWTVRARIRHADGAERIVRLHSEPLFDDDGALTELRGFVHDITELADAEAEIIRAERRYRDLVERLPAVLYVAGAGEHEGWRFVSAQIERLTGWTPDEWLADPAVWRRSLHPDDAERVLEIDRRVLETGAFAVEYRLLTRDGRTVWVHDEAVLRRDDDGRVFLEGLITDVTERKAFETQLQYLADHDPLTGLYNRRRFGAELERETRLAARGGTSGVVLVLDLDNFKYVNDSLGHQAGDALVRGVADIIERRLRGSDTLCRLGGDEFAALLRGATISEALLVAEQLLVEIREHAHAIGGEPVRVTASIGLSPLEPATAERTAEDHLAAADLAMYRAKSDGRDRVAIFSTELQQEIDVGRSWADRVRAALEEDRLTLFCQPIADLSTGTISQWEVLVRMVGEDGSIITPDRFLPIAERFGLMPAIDHWVITRAIGLMEAHAVEGRRLRLEVNVSGASIGDPELTRAIEAALNASIVDPSDLIFEVTETAAIANLEEARAFAERLSALGCRFALDDFGSGFASFYYLKHLPLHYLKIDGDFIRGLCSSSVDQEIVRAMIGIARAFGHRTVAEFVGDQATVELLRQLGVDYAQGYHLGVPRPVAELPIERTAIRAWS